MRSSGKSATVYTAILLLGSVASARGGELKAGIAAVNGTELSYEVQGSGEPLVFIHGGIIASAEWDAQLPAFAAHYRVIRY